MEWRVAWLADGTWNGITWTAEWVWNGVAWLADEVWYGVTWLAEWIWNGLTWIGTLFLPGNFVTDGVVSFYYGYLDSKSENPLHRPFFFSTVINFLIEIDFSQDQVFYFLIE